MGLRGLSPSDIVYNIPILGSFLEFAGVNIGFGGRRKDKRDRYIAKFLEKEIARKGYESTLEQGAELLKSHLSTLPDKVYSKINKIEITEKVYRGKRSLEVNIE